MKSRRIRGIINAAIALGLAGHALASPPPCPGFPCNDPNGGILIMESGFQASGSGGWAFLPVRHPWYMQRDNAPLNDVKLGSAKCPCDTNLSLGNACEPSAMTQGLCIDSYLCQDGLTVAALGPGEQENWVALNFNVAYAAAGGANLQLRIANGVAIVRSLGPTSLAGSGSYTYPVELPLGCYFVELTLESPSSCPASFPLGETENYKLKLVIDPVHGPAAYLYRLYDPFTTDPCGL